MSSYWIFYGTAVSGDGQGIRRQRFNAETFELGPIEVAADLPVMGFQAINSDQTRLYSSFGSDGAVAAYAIDAGSGGLSLLDRGETGGGKLCYVGLDRSESVVLTASYGDAYVSLFRWDEKGKSLVRTQAFQQTGSSGAHSKRQEAAHAHSIYADPSNRYGLVCDLGADKIYVYRFDQDAGTLSPAAAPFARTAPGAGPRHLAFHPNGRWVYSINELNGTITHWNWDAEAGLLRSRGSVDTLPTGFAELNTTAEIIVSKDGRFAYGSNRGHDSIVVYAIDEESGSLTLIQREPCRGQHPRNFNIDPSGRALVVANRDTNNIAFFRIDETTGKIEYADVESSVESGICVRFVRIG